MSTFYTPTVQDFTNLYYRVKCDYTTTTNNTNVKITATFQMQYKGTYKKSSTEGTWMWGSIDFEYTDTPTFSPTTSKSDWTNVGSSVSITETITRTTSSQTAEIQATVGNLNVAKPAEKSVTVTIPALASYSVTYNANGGSGAPSAQKKYYGQTLTLSSTKPTRTGYSFYHWNTNTSNSGTTYNSGASYTGNAALSLYAIWNPIIYYKGNGSSYSASQTKTYGTNIALLSTVPTRDGYVFDKWNTATNGSGTNYSPGATYTANTTLTLYAQWKSLPTKPKITSLTAIRCDSNGDQLDDGTYAKVTTQWSIDTTSQAYPDNTGTVTGIITTQSGSETSFTFSSGDSGTSGTAIAIIPNISTDMQYIVKVTVTDSSNSQTIKSTILTRAFFIMDFKAGGEAIGIGRAAPSSGLEIGYTATFDDKVYLYDQLIMGINENNQSTCAFIIGNGASEDSRSNALTIDWDGNLYCAGLISCTGITSTGNISCADISCEDITATGKVNDVDLYCISTEGTLASSNYQTAIGKYNVEDTNNTYALIIGNGTDGNSRSNAFTVDWNGNIKIYNPNLTVGTTPSSNNNNMALFLGDKDGNRMGCVAYNYGTNGDIGIVLQGYRNVNNTNYYNTLNLSVGTSGDYKVAVSAPAAWRSALQLNNVLDLFRVTSFKKTNVSIGANGTATAAVPITIPSGFTAVCIVNARCDVTNTTSGTNYANCFVYNSWISGTTANVSIKNVGSSAAKVTAWAYILFDRNTL